LVTATVRFDNVSKRFTLRHERRRSFQEAALAFLQGGILSPSKGRDNSREELWALKDVSFAVERGKTLGIIGPNGSGKSTALKLITRILEPTSGQINVQGQVSALIELGAGFHPDLTGRENIYLNGSLLGFSRKEMKAKFESIVEFSELEKFIDVPIKHYSSGMHMRLGFAVAIHVDPDILLIDEILAVGDQAFQNKCLGKIGELKSQGVTIIFVSHDLQAVQDLCDRAIWLEDGNIQQVGQADRVVASYMAAVEEQLEAKLQHQNIVGATARLSSPKSPTRSGMLHIRDVKMVDAAGKPRWTFRSGEPVRIRITYESTERVERPVFSILIHRSDGVYISSTNTYNIDPFEVGPIEGRGELVVTVERLDLYQGDYFLSVGAYVEPSPPFWATPACFLDKRYKFRMLSSSGVHGILVLPAKWEHRPGVKKEETP
jgi:ABC-type polysaccharide/polyol phosphate transport system ATPase subunit